MKLEMGESLGFSWMKHVKRCQLVQTNWKVSPEWSDENSDAKERLQDIAEEIKKFYQETNNGGYYIFRGNANLDQIFRQAECDMIGCSINNGVASYYSLEVAYHGDTLNYNGRELTIAKVLSKLVKSAFIFYRYFGVTNAEIAFASPKVGNFADELTTAVERLQDIFKPQGCDFIFKLYINDGFKNELLDKVIGLSKEVKDTSELFLRSYQLYNQFYQLPTTPATAASGK